MALRERVMSEFPFPFPFSFTFPSFLVLPLPDQKEGLNNSKKSHLGEDLQELHVSATPIVILLGH